MSNVVTRVLARLWFAGVANVAMLLGLKRRALGIYRRMVELDPRDEVARSTIGNLRMALGDREGAIDEFRELVAISPDNADAWFNLGFLLEGREQLNEAERAFRRAAQLDDAHDRAWYGLGLVLIRENRLAEAVEVLKKNVKLQPFSPYGYYQLGMTYHHLGESRDAWRIYEQLKGFEPRYAATLRRDIEATAPRSGDSAKPTIESEEEALAPTP